MTEYVDVREIHPDFAKAPCKYCDTVSYANADAIERHGHTFCLEHDPLWDGAKEAAYELNTHSGWKEVRI